MSQRSHLDVNNVAAYICPHVFEHSRRHAPPTARVTGAEPRPVLLVSRADGDWQLLCGGLHEDEEGPFIACLGHLIDTDPSLEEILDLQEEFEAEREAVGKPWKRRLPQ